MKHTKYCFICNALFFEMQLVQFSLAEVAPFRLALKALGDRGNAEI